MCESGVGFSVAYSARMFCQSEHQKYTVAREWRRRHGRVAVKGRLLSIGRWAGCLIVP